MSLITPERATELLALLPDNTAAFVDLGEELDGIYLVFGKSYEEGGIRSVATLPDYDDYEDHKNAWPVLAASADALRTIQHLYALLEQHGITVPEREA